MPLTDDQHRALTYGLYGTFFVKGASRHLCRALLLHSLFDPRREHCSVPTAYYRRPSRTVTVKDGASSAPPKACPSPTRARRQAARDRVVYHAMIRGEPAIGHEQDLWSLGIHRLLCADARDEAAYDHLLEGAKAEFVFTDPPYNVAIDGNVCGLGRIRHREFAMGCGEMSEVEFTTFLQTVFDRLAEHTIDGSIHQICMDWRHMWEMLAAGRQVYELKNLCVWNKTNAGMRSFYRSKHELVFVWKSGSAAHIQQF
jgi:hypothetical protein